MSAHLIEDSGYVRSSFLIGGETGTADVPARFAELWEAVPAPPADVPASLGRGACILAECGDDRPTADLEAAAKDLAGRCAGDDAAVEAWEFDFGVLALNTSSVDTPWVILTRDRDKARRDGFVHLLPRLLVALAKTRLIHGRWNRAVQAVQLGTDPTPEKELQRPPAGAMYRRSGELEALLGRFVALAAPTPTELERSAHRIGSQVYELAEWVGRCDYEVHLLGIYASNLAHAFAVPPLAAHRADLERAFLMPLARYRAQCEADVHHARVTLEKAKAILSTIETMSGVHSEWWGRATTNVASVFAAAGVVQVFQGDLEQAFKDKTWLELPASVIAKAGLLLGLFLAFLAISRFFRGR